MGPGGRPWGCHRVWGCVGLRGALGKGEVGIAVGLQWGQALWVPTGGAVRPYNPLPGRPLPHSDANPPAAP